MELECSWPGLQLPYTWLIIGQIDTVHTLPTNGKVRFNIIFPPTSFLLCPSYVSYTHQWSTHLSLLDLITGIVFGETFMYIHMYICLYIVQTSENAYRTCLEPEYF